MKLKEWQKITLLIVVIFVAVIIFSLFILSSIPDESPPLSQDSFLELTIFGEIAERTADDRIADLFEAPVGSMQTYLHVIHKAQIDDKIKGIILRTGIRSMGWAKTEELRKSLMEFKASGKPIYAYLEIALNKDYYLASVADTILGISSGILLMNGFSSQPIFLKNTLAKIGIEFDAVAYGKYKNAPDMFTRDDMSDAEREVINDLLDDRFSHFISHIAQNRSLPESGVKQLIDQGFFNFEKAKNHNLIDTLMYYNQFKEFLKKRYGKRLRFVSVKRYRDIPLSKLGVKAKKNIGLVYAVGTIVSGGAGEFGQDGLITSEGMANSIRRLADDNNIKAIIMRIDSPGGSGLASDVIWREVVRAREKKPVVVSMSDVAASGGYYIAMAADSIIAHPSSIIGSIGVYTMKPILGKMYDKIGMTVEELNRGKNANLFSELHHFTPEQRELVMNLNMDFYREFVTKASEGRNMTYEEIDNIAQGRVWSGKKGLEIGLVDKLGGFDEAITMAKKMAGITDKYVRLVIYPKQKTFIEKLLGGTIEVFAEKHLPELQSLPPALKSLVRAIPYFHATEPMLLSTLFIEIN
jgi:protease-4